MFAGAACKLTCCGIVQLIDLLNQQALKAISADWTTTRLAPDTTSNHLSRLNRLYRPNHLHRSTVKIRWIGPNGSYITEDRSQRIHAESSGPHGHRLVVMNATVGQDDGQYRCTIGSTDDRQPRETVDFGLKLFQAANFRDTPRHLVLAEGQSGTLNCRVEFDPSVASASVEWLRDGQPLEIGNGQQRLQVVDYDPGSQSSQLILNPVGRDSEANYSCRAVAVTSQLSRISEHNIELEVLYAPFFDSTHQTIWVESSSSLASRLNQSLQATTLHQQRHDPGQQLASHRNIFGPGRGRLQKHGSHHSSSHRNDLAANATAADDSIRVELRCTCQSNPNASILWTSSQSSMYVLSKGEPAHVAEEPRIELNGRNSTSILVINYNLDPSWPYRHEQYICSASNKLGKAAKTFVIEQGDTPPAFEVDAQRHYDPQTSLFRFTLLGPNFNPSTSSSPSSPSSSAEASTPRVIMPPIDAFRIRAEQPVASATPTSGGGAESRTSYARRYADPSVQWTVAGGNGHQANHLSSESSNNQHNNHYEQQQAVGEQPVQVSFSQADLVSSKPKNVTVNLGKLPSGSLRLFLEAHNAVGWSPNATYLGDYYIVSSAHLLLPNVLTHLWLPVLLLLHLIRSR